MTVVPASVPGASVPGAGVSGASGFSVSVADVASVAAAFGRAHVAAAGASVAASGVLAGAAGMAGDDPVLAAWRARYDAVARAAWASATAVVGTVHDVGARLVATGDAYLAADHASAPGAPGVPGTLPPVGPAAAVGGGPPSATGHTGGEAPSRFAEYWPGGDPEALRRAGAAWAVLAERLDDAALDADAAFRGLLAHNSGVGFSAMRAFWASRYVPCGVEPLFNAAPDGARTVGRVCVGLADLVERTRVTVERASEDAARDAEPVEALGVIPGPPGRVAAVIGRLAGPGLASAYVELARRDYLAGLDDLVRQLSPEVEGRLERAARFPERADPPGLTVADVGEVTGLGLRGSGWDGLAGDHPTPDSVQLTGSRRTHILDGDRSGGGHRPGTGKPNKSEFPATWTDDHVLRSVLSVARDPDSERDRVFQDWNDRWKVQGVRDGVLIEVVLERDGEVITAYPVSGPGVRRNPPGR